jgi:hypothetical protein
MNDGCYLVSILDFLREKQNKATETIITNEEKDAEQMGWEISENGIRAMPEETDDDPEKIHV